MYVDKALAAKAKVQKNPDDKDLAACERAHWNIVYGYAMAAVTVLSLTVEEDEAYVIVSAWRKESTDEYERSTQGI
jgi:hypothetical protein